MNTNNTIMILIILSQRFGSAIVLPDPNAATLQNLNNHIFL